MRAKSIILLAVLAVLTGGLWVGPYAENESTAHVAYVPPLKGAPKSRVGGGTRGPSGFAELEALAPLETGWTTSDHPSLYWYLSAPVSARMEFTLTQPGVVEPLLEVRLSTPMDAGFHGLDLGDHGVNLAPDVVYRWFVTIVLATEQRSNDILASGTIRYVKPEATALGDIDVSSAIAKARAYAQAGIWYDAIAFLTADIATKPGTTDLRLQRAVWLEQAGLEAAAAADRNIAVTTP